MLKQQGHFDAINALAYSPEGQRIISASDDGKIKVWDTKSGFCNVTFTEHSSGVSACEFAKRGNVLFTASLDGSVRAWDLIRYRNFRTFTAPSRLSFTCVAVDPSGEVVCAGSSNSFDIHIWSVQTGQLLDQLSGHQGPISSLAFTPSGSMLVSGSWDHTVRLWSIFNRAQTNEPLQLQAEVLDIAIRPDSKEVAVSSLDGQLTFWSLAEAVQSHGLSGRRDVTGGRNLSDRRTAASSAESKNFGSISYSMDGSCVIAGGNSKYICLYDVQSGSLLKKFTVSVDLSLQGTQEYLNSRNLTEGGPIELIDDQGEASDLGHRIDRTLPGVHRGDFSSRKLMPQVRVTALAFSPSAQGFCAASTEGLLIYSLDEGVQFDPFNLEIDVTPENTIAAVAEQQYLRALVMAFRLNERPLLDRVFQALPVDAIGLLVMQLPKAYLSTLIRFLVQASDESPHIERNLKWIEALLSNHGPFLKNNSASFATDLMALQKAIANIQAHLSRLTDDNIYILDYLLS